MTAAHAGNGSRDTPPSTGEIAELLDTDATDFLQLVGAIDPDTAGELVRRGLVDEEHRDAVEAWFDGAETNTGRPSRPTDAPTASDLADRLGVERRRLLQFVDFHPDPRPTYVLGWANAGPEHEDAVEAWLDERKSEPVDLSEADPTARDDARRGRLVR